MIYLFSNKLGGRSEIMTTPVVELLGYTIEYLEEKEEQAEREQQKYYLDFISRIKAQKPENKKEARELEEFIKSIKPETYKDNQIQDGQAWDIEALKNAKDLLEGG